VRSIFLYNDTNWFSSGGNYSVIQSPIAQDPYGRVYFTNTDEGYPQVTSNLIAIGAPPFPSATYRLGVQAPSVALSCIVNVDAGADASDFSDDETRYYVMTYVTGYGEEGAPSPVSFAVELASPSTETVTLTLPIPLTNDQNITHKRIYRTVTSGSGTYYYFVKQVALAITSTIDDVAGISLGAELTTIDYDTPPDNMTGLVLGSNGIAAGFAGNEFMPSEPNLPYTYPVKYRLTTEHDIVAVAATSSGFIVATKGNPVVISGISPDSLTPQKIDVPHACVSGRSLVDMGEYAIYASPNGLVIAGSNRAELITESIISKRDWESYSPETIHAYRNDDLYIAFYGDIDANGSGVGGFIFNPKNGDFTLLDFYASAGFNHLVTDTLYLVVGGSLRAWQGSDTLLEYTWLSKEFRGNSTIFSCVKIYTDNLAGVAFTLYVDGVAFYSLGSLTTASFRLPPIRGSVWQFRVTGSSSIERVAFAQSLGEFE